MEGQKLLEVQNLETVFTTDEGQIKAVDNVSFHLNRGETLGIVGESGSGKSVTSLSIMRLIPSPPGKISGGEIIYRDHNEEAVDLVKTPLAKMRSYRGNEIAMIFQEPMTSLNPVYTCGDQVMEAISLHQNVSRKEARLKTIELFKEVKLPRPEQMLDAYPHQISGGQKQRVMIAMAMSCNPSILIADEPTTALDVTVQKSILELMKKLQEKHGMSIIFITHDLGVIAEIADRVLVMYNGKIVEEGETRNIFKDPRHPYTKGLLACRPPLGKRLKFLPTMADFLKESGAGDNKTVEEVTLQKEISDSERKERLNKLYDQQPILEIKNLKTYFPVKSGVFGRVKDYVKAVDDVTFEVYPGEIMGLVGESGCGKTTLGRTILRLTQKTSGQVLYNGQEIFSLKEKEMRLLRKDIQIIFQDPYSSLNPRMTVGAAIMEPMKVHGIHPTKKLRKEKTLELLERVNLKPEHFNRYPHEFSGGQRQRICIARALAVDPKFIICDESVSALDVSVQAQVLNLLIELRNEFNLTYIFISHDLSVVKFMADRIIVMNNGKIEEMGDSEETYKNPKTTYTRQLIAAIPKGL